MSSTTVLNIDNNNIKNPEHLISILKWRDTADWSNGWYKFSHYLFNNLSNRNVHIFHKITVFLSNKCSHGEHKTSKSTLLSGVAYRDGVRPHSCSELEIDRYIGLPIFFLIFKHFTIIGYRFWEKKTITNHFFFFFDVLCVIAYFNIPENIIQWIILHSLVY